MKRWSERPGAKVPVLRFDLECWAAHMEEPERWLASLREHAREIKLQLALHDEDERRVLRGRSDGRPMPPPGRDRPAVDPLENPPA
jgi:hypothetical protein